VNQLIFAVMGFQAASPMGKVPAIGDGEVQLAESAAIALYLARPAYAAALQANEQSAWSE
jgi:glutathione S-transferase